MENSKKVVSEEMKSLREAFETSPIADKLAKALALVGELGYILYDMDAPNWYERGDIRLNALIDCKNKASEIRQGLCSVLGRELESMLSGDFIK